jgi:transcriptional regulator with XRE-family HTH domain
VTVLGMRLRQTREKVGLNQEDVGAAIGKTRTAISYYEAGKRNPTPHELAIIAKLFGVSTDYLVGATDDPRTANQRIEDAISDSAELRQFWQLYHGSAEVKLMLESLRDLTPATARKIVTVMKAVIEAEIGKE